MRHRVTVKKLSKTPAHRKAMLRNMLVALYRHEQIKTTHAKSKVFQRIAEKLITRAKNDTVHNRRIAAKWVQDKDILKKLFEEIGPRFTQRPGGYTRITKIGQRYGDASEMVYIGLVEGELASHTKSKKEKKESKKELVTQQNKESKTTRSKDKKVETAKVAQDEVKESSSDTLIEETAVQETPQEDSKEPVAKKSTVSTVEETETATDESVQEETEHPPQATEEHADETKPSD